MKEVVLASTYGFCYGVRRAIDLAKSHPGAGVIYGELVHNPTVTEEMAREGKTSVRDMAALDGKRAFITAHGVSRATKGRIAAKASEVVDATCPLVTRVHDAARRYEEQGYQVVLVGERGHPESVGTLGDLRAGILVEDEADVAMLSRFPKLAVIAQTTIDVAHFSRVAALLREKGDEVVVENTICVPTRDRQKAAHELARQVDAMVVVGGRNSSNTVRLAQLSRVYCPTVHVTCAQDLDPSWFAPFARIGVTAGASTPDGVVQEVAGRIRTF